MLSEISFFLSIAFSLVAWGIVIARYVWPRLRDLPRPDAIRPLLVLHSFRFAGLAFLVPGVVGAGLPSAFAHGAAYGDLGAAVLALVALSAQSHRVGVPLVWLFNVWGTVDLLTAFYLAGTNGLIPGQLGATYFIPTLVVPMLMITHAVIFRLLLSPSLDAGLSLDPALVNR
jgi:hypothetical protein